MPFLLIAGGYLAYKFIEIKNAIYGLQTTLSGISFGKTDLSNTAIQLSLRVTNPSNVNLSFKRFSGQIFIQAQPIAAFTIDNPVNIPANGIAIVPLDATVLNLNMLSNLSTLMDTGMKNLILKGTITLGGINLPVNMNLADG